MSSITSSEQKIHQLHPTAVNQQRDFSNKSRIEVSHNMSQLTSDMRALESLASLKPGPAGYLHPQQNRKDSLSHYYKFNPS